MGAIEDAIDGAVDAGDGDGDSQGTPAPLSARVIDSAAAPISSIALCPGECASVTAEAVGGNPNYTFMWSDGTASPARRLCPESATLYSVTVQDTARSSPPYAGDRATAQVKTEIRDCSDAGGNSEFTALCRQGVSAPFQLLPKNPSQLLSYWQDMNGIASYRGNSPFGEALIIVAQAAQALDMGSCTKLLLASDAAGTLPIGWEAKMIVEYRSAPGASVEKSFYLGVDASIYSTAGGAMLPRPLAPTVPALSLDPGTATFDNTGYEPLAIDLVALAPPGNTKLTFSVYVVTGAGIGNNTAIWAIPR